MIVVIDDEEVKAEMTPHPLLAIQGLIAGYVPDVDVLRNIDLKVDGNEIVTLLGPNGAGKSTLVKAVIGLLAPRHGHVAFCGEDTTSMRPYELVRKGMGYVPQVGRVFPSMTVEENLLLAGLNARSRLLSPMTKYVMDLFPRLAERRKQPAGTLSGGEQQMLAIARALVPAPSLLLLDEPSAGLSPAYVDIVFEQFIQVKSTGVAILLAEQNARLALEISDRGCVLDLGVKRFEGRGAELLDDPRIASLYLGAAPREGNS